ncbi:MAG: DedA family protein [Hyphomicrobiales bacterium]|nr:DedA family protein [Hyphomicrobiales bacterium]
MFKALHDWTIRVAESPNAPYALAAVAFAEASFFPVPPDMLLLPMAMAKPKSAWRYAAIATVASVVGGALGYAIGALLFETAGKWIISLYGAGARFEALRAFYAQWGAWFILIKGLTPIPFKLVTILSGAMGYDFPLFLLLAAITRGARFFLVAGAMRAWGHRLRDLFDRHFAAFVSILAIAVVGGFWLVTRFA